MTSYIYLDNNATTPLDQEILQAMLVDLETFPLNPSSTHALGQKAHNYLARARKKVASYLKVLPEEIIFTSGGTEGINMAIKGILHGKPRGQILTTQIEHACIDTTVKLLEKEGYEITYVKVGSKGTFDPTDVEKLITPKTQIMIFSAANSETGVKMDVEALATIALKANVPLVIDGVAMLGKEPVKIYPGVSSMCFSGHKIHAPKGVGFIYLNKRAPFAPLLTGGLQENGKRAGTENLSGILGLAKGIEILEDKESAITRHILSLKEHFENTLKKELTDIFINGEAERVCNTSNISFLKVSNETLLSHLDMQQVYASIGSACSSKTLLPSRILQNMGLAKERVETAIRFSFSRRNTKEEIDRALDIIIATVKRIRELAFFS